MTENTTPEADAPGANATPEADAGVTNVPPEPEEERAPEDKEAAKYRRRLRDTEAERDRLTDRLTTLQRREVERLAADHLADGADLWRDGAQLEDVLDDDGDIDADKVTDLARTLLESHRHWRRNAPAAPPASTVTANGKITAEDPQVTWTDLLKQSTKEARPQRVNQR
ncbi:hypothetical protein MGALJ_10030 [Mycobacterium gallinarum]|uniref:Scaffolding protein n=1 Tax=Mycobacterium gallinarum TaxID=39689 RepID=A0A9W4BF95_9MYCO|nr:hypothetical protein [Mycobacterium gallinarum]BBY91334.1 hypothetical protein MGALJ_10030 [Mycobacterium gallinarum]